MENVSICPEWTCSTEISTYNVYQRFLGIMCIREISAYKCVPYRPISYVQYGETCIQYGRSTDSDD